MDRIELIRAAENAIMALLTPKQRANANTRIFRMRLAAIIESIIELVNSIEPS